MIIEGNPAGSVSFWSNHLLRTDTNERAEIKEVRGTIAEDLKGVLREMEALSAGSNSGGNFMYQANINPLAEEHLTPEQWKRAIDLLEERLGLTDHQRVVVEHVKNGREHYHVIWNRVDAETMRVADMGGNYYTHERTARELEREFGLEPTPRVHGEREGSRSDRPIELWEQQRGEKTGINPKEMRAELTEIWRASDNGQAFAGAVMERGYVLARGDRRDFIIVDHCGDTHSLARRLEGVKAKDVRAQLADLDRESLPSAEDAAAYQRSRHLSSEGTFDRAAAAKAWADRPSLSDVNKAEAAKTEHEEAQRKIEAQQAAARENATRLAEMSAAQDLKAAFAKDEAALKNDWAQNFVERARQQAQDIKQERREQTFWGQQEAWRIKVDQQHNPNSINPGAALDKGLQVVDTATGAASKLTDYVTDLLAGAPAKEPKPDMKSFVTNPEARKEQQLARLASAKHAKEEAMAIERIARDMEQGKSLGVADVRALSHQHQEQIKTFGDDGMRQIVDEARKRAATYWKGSERELE